LLSDNAAQCQKRPLAIGFGKRFPELSQWYSLIWLQRARGGTGQGLVCRMVILRAERVPGERESNPPSSGARRHQLSRLAPKIDNAEVQVWSLCVFCNLHKGPNLTGIDPATDQIVPLFNPRQDTYSEHFEVRGAFIVGLTPQGRATVNVLAMNSAEQLAIRSDAE
jgi:hypothetical protein